MTNDEEIRVAITARADEYNAAMAQVSADTEAMRAKVAEEAAAFNAAQQAKFDALMRLGTAFKSGLASNEALAEAEGALDQAMAAGAITAQEYATYVARLDAAETAMAASTTAATASIDANTAAMTINGGVARELGVLIGELARGNYTRLEGSTITLANRTGILSRVFSPLGVGIMGAAGAALYLGDQFLKAQETADAFNRALLVTGDLVGTTAGELNGLAMQIGTFTGNTAQADEIVQKLAQSGKLSGQTLQYAAQAAANAMQLTGESAQQAAHEVESLAGDPTKAVVALNGKYHFLTLEIYEQISKLQAEGDAFGAAEVAAKAFADSTSDRLDALNDKMGFFERQVSDFKRGFDAIDQGLRKAFDPTLEEQSAAATHKAVQAQYALNEAIKAYGNIGGDDAKQAIATARQYAEETRKAALALRDKVKAQQEDAQQQAKVGQQNTRLIQEVNEQEKLNQHLQETSLLQEKIAEEKRRVEDIHKNDPGSDAIKGITFDASGAVAGGEQWQAILKKLQREFGETKAKAISLHKSLEEQLEIDESTDQVSFRNREKYELAFWQRKLGTLKQGTLQYAQVYRTIQSLTKEVDDEQARQAKEAAQAELATLQTTVQASKDSAEEKRRANERAFREGAESAEQYLAIEKAIDKDLLASYAEYVTRKRELDAGNTKALQEDAKLLETYQHAVNDDMAKSAQQAAQKTQQAWNNAANQITHEMVNGFNQMMFASKRTNVTLMQEAEQTAARIVESMVDQVLERWIGAEAKKLAASIQTLFGIGTANTTQAAADVATDKAKSAALVTDAVAVAGAQGVASFSGAPWPVDMGAPAFGASMAAVAAGFGSVASAAGGWDRVPVDDAPALLHRNEMVLPANLAERVRGMTDQGGAGGGVHHHHYNIQAWDSRSMRDTLRRNPHLLADAAMHAKRKGF